MDIRLPDMDGTEAARALARGAATAAIPVVAFSSLALEANARLAPATPGSPATSRSRSTSRRSPSRCAATALADPKERGTGRRAPVAGRVDGDDAEAKPPAPEHRRHQPVDGNCARPDLEAHRQVARGEQRAVLVDSHDGLAPAAVVEHLESQRCSLPPTGRDRIRGDERRSDIGGGEGSGCRETLQGYRRAAGEVVRASAGDAGPFAARSPRQRSIGRRRRRRSRPASRRARGPTYHGPISRPRKCA